MTDGRRGTNDSGDVLAGVHRVGGRSSKSILVIDVNIMDIDGCGMGLD